MCNHLVVVTGHWWTFDENKWVKKGATFIFFLMLGEGPFKSTDNVKRQLKGVEKIYTLIGEAIHGVCITWKNTSGLKNSVECIHHQGTCMI